MKYIIALLFLVFLVTGCMQGGISPADYDKAFENVEEWGLSKDRVEGIIKSCKDIACTERTEINMPKGIEENNFIVGSRIRLNIEKSTCRADEQDDTLKCSVKGDAPVNFMVDKVNPFLYESVAKISQEAKSGTYHYELVFDNEEGASQSLKINVTVQ
jgi:hypothetical protein